MPPAFHTVHRANLIALLAVMGLAASAAPAQTSPAFGPLGASTVATAGGATAKDHSPTRQDKVTALPAKISHFRCPRARSSGP